MQQTLQIQPNAIENLGVDDLVEILLPAFPRLSPVEQKVSLQIHRLLARGHRLDRQCVADSLRMPLERIDKILNRLWGIHYDRQKRIIAYWGLSIRKTPHRFEVGGQTMYTWCAWDTLFLPEILRTGARIDSLCATTDSPIRLTISPERVEHIQPKHAVISFLTPDAARVKEDVVGHFCSSVHFFESEQAGLVWIGQHAGTFLLTIDEAYILGRKINASLYRDV